MYTSTHKILFLYFITKLSCSKTAETSQKIARSFCHKVVDEAENLHKIINLDFTIDHCLIDLWLEQSTLKFKNITKQIWGIKEWRD